tara:strand:- start:1154 stop:1393 length:240 start_codon:yes stop_codon:yes gene_type:complete
MKISKKQLRQIIREEYARLKNRRILKEEINEYLVDAIRLAMDEMDHMLDEMTQETLIEYIQAKFPHANIETIIEAISSY